VLNIVYRYETFGLEEYALILLDVKVIRSVKVNFTLEQATEVQRGIRGITLLFF
jgi:hypothetical protein